MKKLPKVMCQDMMRIQEGLVQIALLGTDAGGSNPGESLLRCEAIARDLLNHRHRVWQWGLGKPDDYRSPYASTLPEGGRNEEQSRPG